MGKLIVSEEKPIKAKGLKKTTINQEKLQEYFFPEDLENLELLNNITLNVNKKEVSLLYPGAGADIFFPLIYLEKLLPQIKKANLIFVDQEDNLGIIKTSLDNVGISFKGKKKIFFYWKDTLIKLKFVSKPIETLLPKQKQFDLYFEKAFRIMRDEIPNYENLILSKLNQEGIIISDTGFIDKNLKIVKVPKTLSAYGEMIIGIKSI